MIDVYNEVFTSLRTTLKTTYQNIVVMSASQDVSAKFPCVTLKQSGDSTDVGNVDSDGEFTSTLMFEVNIFTTGQKREIENKRIQKTVDEVMNFNLGMLRLSSEDVENYIDKSIHRHVFRYSCKVSKNKLIYRR